MAVRVAEAAGVAAVEGLPGGLRDLGPRGGRVGQQCVDLGPRPEVVRQDDAIEAARAAIGHAAVLGELGPPPQDHGHAPGLEEDGLLALLAAPAQAFVERPGAADVGDAERDQADALFHASNLTDATDISGAGSPCRSGPGCPASRATAVTALVIACRCTPHGGAGDTQ